MAIAFRSLALAPVHRRLGRGEEVGRAGGGGWEEKDEVEKAGAWDWGGRSVPLVVASTSGERGTLTLPLPRTSMLCITYAYIVYATYSSVNLIMLSLQTARPLLECSLSVP